MSNNRMMTPGPINGGNCNPMPKEAVCVDTRKVYDSCKDKECLQDLRVYLTRCSQPIFESAINVKPKSAELLWAYIDVEPISFNKGFYTVDVRYFYKVTADAFCGVGRPREIHGLATYDKRTVLFGSEGNARIFSSSFASHAHDIQQVEKTNLPIAVVEVVDPVCLGVKTIENQSCCDPTSFEIPDGVCRCFDDDLVACDEGKRLYATLGQFSIIRLERDIQLLMPAYDICLPEKECSGNSDDPCDLFQSFKFPVDEFFPPKQADMIKVKEQPNGRRGCCN